uniref:Reverse transcriptase domain-containing protein n=1 Tax=Tanacetum cinerariifolium TaxID=118510 RepID=A0A6L2K3I9_TANCI|nr:reverse transcriptase domain-containing protein [Tanacetum cinerariifolium]
MTEDFSPKVQSQRRVNPKIHDVIKKEVKKLLDAGLIYPISDSPWKVVEDVGEDDDFKSGSWGSATDYVNANGGISCYPNVIADLTVTMKDLLVFSPKPSVHYLNITMRNVVKVFRKDTVPGRESGNG